MPDVTPVPLSQLTTLRTGGLPERMVDAVTTDELVDTLHDVWARGEPWLVLGGGSNLFVGDRPFDGTVVRVLTHGIERMPSPVPGRVRLRAQAGHDWDALVAYAVSEGLAGIEAMSGIPGTVGAAPIQNIGAYGQDVAQTLVEVELIDEGSDHVAIVPREELGLGFRTSRLKHHYESVSERRAVILSVTFELVEAGHGEHELTSAQLRTAVGRPRATLARVRHRVLELRRRSGMVLDPEDSDTNSVGSFFQNAIVSAEFAATLPLDCPRWSLGPDRDDVTVIPLDQYHGIVPVQAGETPDYKLSSAWLIEHAGFRKGFRLPRSRAAISSKHALALVNRGGATAEEIAELARFVRTRVESDFGLRLHVEPMLVGVEI